MIPIFEIIIGASIVSFLIVIILCLIKKKKVYCGINRYSKKWFVWIALFCCFLFLMYAINLRLSLENLKYTEVNRFGQEVEKFEVDNKNVFTMMRMADGTYQVIDFNGNYNAYQEKKKKLWKFVGFGYLLFFVYIFFDRKRIAEKIKTNKIYQIIKRRNENAI